MDSTIQEVMCMMDVIVDAFPRQFLFHFMSLYSYL